VIKKIITSLSFSLFHLLISWFLHDGYPIPFLTPNQHCHITEGKNWWNWWLGCLDNHQVRQVNSHSVVVSSLTQWHQPIYGLFQGNPGEPVRERMRGTAAARNDAGGSGNIRNSETRALICTQLQSNRHNHQQTYSQLLCLRP